MTLPAFAAERSAPGAIDRYILLIWRSAASPPAALAAVNRWGRHTDGRTQKHRPRPLYQHIIRNTVVSRASCGVRCCNGLRDCFSRSLGFRVPRIVCDSVCYPPFRQYSRLARMACVNLALGRICCSPSVGLVYCFFPVQPVGDRWTPRVVANFGTVCNRA